MARQQSKDVHEKHQAILSKLLKDDDNKYCVDCDAKGPRWASWNLGVFLCIRCAGIHRNLGVHISKVKSINLDSWTPEQIASVEDMGNSRARAVYEANLPDHYKRPASSDASMEQFVRAKYEHKKYIAKEWVPSKPRAVPSHYYDVEKETKKEAKKQSKTILTIPGAAAGTTATSTKTTKVERTTPSQKNEPAPALMVDLSSPAKQVNGSANPPTSSADLLADIFSSPAPPGPSAGSAQNDLFGMSTTQQPANSQQQQSGGDNSEDLFKVGDEKSQSAKDSIMALYGNTPNPQPSMMSNSFNMPNASYGQQQMMFSNGAMMGTSYPQQVSGVPMMGSYSMAGQQPNTIMTSQQGMMGNRMQPGMMGQTMPQQGMMGNMQQQGMMGNMQQQGVMGNMQQQGMMGNMQQQGMMGNMQQQGMMGNMQQHNMYATQQLQSQMTNLSLNQQQMSGMSQVAAGNAGASWGSSSGLSNGQTLNHNLWN